MSESSTEIAVDSALLERVQDALVPLQADSGGDARGTAASAAALLRGALLQLSSPELARLQELHERAIRAAASRT